MTHDEIKAFIADRTREGHNLSKIQDMLAEQGVKMTFMELRLIASEIETSFWQKSEPQPEAAPEAEKPVQDAAPAEEADEVPVDDAGSEQLPPDDAAPADDGKDAPRGRTTVTIDHGDGMRSVYANLDAETAVKAGEWVDTGVLLGTVGASALCEIGQPTHLHFEMRLNGALVDPAAYLSA